MKNPTMTLHALPAAQFFDLTNEACPVQIAMDEAERATVQ